MATSRHAIRTEKDPASVELGPMGDTPKCEAHPLFIVQAAATLRARFAALISTKGVN
jgi:hypothetical protein